MVWDIEVVRGEAAEFHTRPIPDVVTPSLWWFEVEHPTLVLGSGQSRDVVDAVACLRLGVDVVTRHSGGAAVLVVPGDVAWFDVLIPSGYERWDDDVSRAAWWVGEAVQRALGEEALEVHRGPMVKTPWSPLVCFAGLGPGELTRDGRKVLGLSQRRTREAIRYQCVVYRRWDPSLLVEVLGDHGPSRSELVDMVATADLTLEALVGALDR